MRSSPKFSLTFVTPRYGVEVVGGAETAARKFAEHMVGLGHDVSVLTTAAKDSNSWANELPLGTRDVNGVQVSRYSVEKGRSADFLGYADRVLPVPQSATPGECERFLEMQGPISGELIEAIARSDVDIMAFYPYLFHPTVQGMKSTRSIKVLHPAAHDEAALALPIYQETFASADALVYHTHAESELVRSRFSVSATPSSVIGLGIDPPPKRSGSSWIESLGLGHSPYLLCVGRVDGHKGTTMLSHFFQAYQRGSASNLKLVFAGQVVVPPVERPDIICVGQVTEDQKWELLSHASLLVQPSYFEAFSFVLFEAWSQSKAVLVNAACEATTEHVHRSGGGLTFGSYREFAAVLDLLLAKKLPLGEIGSRGHRYYEGGFKWDAVVERYEAFLGDVLRHRRPR